MANSTSLYNEFSKTYLAIDPTTQGYGLRALTPNDTPLSFTFSSIPGNFIKICTTVSGNPYCLDVWGDKKYIPHLADPGNYIGQQWFVTSSSSGSKFSNNYTGVGYFLDVYSDTKQTFMSNGDYSGQYWSGYQVR